jgi:hypothetical protein
MKNMSDEELINQAAGFSCGCDKCLARVEPPKKELLSRLERGRKAIEAMENIGLCISVLNDFNAKYKMNDIIEIFREYQQS